MPNIAYAWLRSESLSGARSLTAVLPSAKRYSAASGHYTCQLFRLNLFENGCSEYWP
ncbi:hypothetical protein [Novipirellula sp.]|uniref:hypothetical protein n=1 Tax=Novipirellula sp. TaxID=2795430 RepID=UPI00356316CA